jgi:hypothetical protein
VTQGRVSGTGHRVWPVGALRTVFVGGYLHAWTLVGLAAFGVYLDSSALMGTLSPRESAVVGGGALLLQVAVSSRDIRPCAFGIAARPWISCCTGEAGAASWSRRASDVYHQCPRGKLRPRFPRWAHR